MTNKRILGPGMDPTEVKIDFPKCIQVKTEQDAKEMNEFIASIIKATQQNAVDRLAETIAKQNELFSNLAKALGATDAG